MGGGGAPAWTLVAALRDAGFAIDESNIADARAGQASLTDVLRRGRQPAATPQAPLRPPPPPDIRRADAKLRAKESILGVVRELLKRTKMTEAVTALPLLGRRMLGVPDGDAVRQVTFVRNQESSQQSFTAIVPESAWNDAAELHTFVFVDLEGMPLGNEAIWIARKIHLV